jgi:PTH1 family peptidyl-tRNA hydrolase
MIPGPRLVLAIPSSYMNLSGGPVSALAGFYGVPAERLLVVHDELDLPLGRLRLKRDGGEGGHNGLRSVSQSLGRRDYCRLRLGIGRPPGRMDPADFVLRDFSSAEREDAGVMIHQAADVIRDIAVLGWDRAQAEVNGRAHAD